MKSVPSPSSGMRRRSRRSRPSTMAHRLSFTSRCMPVMRRRVKSPCSRCGTTAHQSRICSHAIPYLGLQRFFDADYPAHEMRYYWKSRYLNELSAEATDALIRLDEVSPSDYYKWMFGNSVGRSAASHRRTPPSVIVPRRISSVSRPTGRVQRMTQHASNGEERLFVRSNDSQVIAIESNFPGLYEEGDQSVRATFGANLGRLQSVKRTYDPDNLFRLNHNIPPPDPSS